MVSKRDERPASRRIAADLRARIMSGELAPGEQLPSTHQLMGQHAVPSGTVQNAVKILKSEGFVRGETGRGIYVRDRQPVPVQVAAYFEPGTSNRYSYRVLQVAEVRPPAAVAAALNIDADLTAVLRHRVMLEGGDPVELSWSYYPAEIAAGTALARRAKIPGGAPRALAELGYPQRRCTDWVSARPPTAEELEGLNLPGEVAVLRQFRVVYSDADRPVEASVLIKGSHRIELVYDVPTAEDS